MTQRNWRTESRDWTCRGCGHAERDVFVPIGWLQLQRVKPDAHRDNGRTYGRVGVFCSLACFDTWVADQPAH